MCERLLFSGVDHEIQIFSKIVRPKETEEDFLGDESNNIIM